MRFFHPLRHSLLLVSGLCGGLIVFAQHTPKYNSLLWRISGNGLAAPSYLYGTMHVSNKLVFNLTEEFFQAFGSCGDVAMEMDPEEWLPAMTRSDLFRALYAARQSGLLGDDLYGQGFALDIPDAASYRSVLSVDPSMVNDLMYRMTEKGADNEESTFLDLFIYQCARKRNKRVHGLEQFDTVMKLFVEAMMPDENAKDDGNDRRRATLLEGGDPMRAIEDAYRAGDLDRIDTLMDISLGSTKAKHVIIDVRNRNFLANMEPLMQQGPLFTAVGVGHLPGDSGLVELLRGRGYTVEAVHGAATARSAAERNKLDLTYLARPSSTQGPDDGAFTMDLSSPFYELPSLLTGGTPLLLSTDNVNGAFYSVSRVPTYAAFRGLSQEQVLAQVDSLLYESIPGRIQRVERNDAEGRPGFSVHSISREGHGLWFRIYVDPMEVLVFKRTGKNIKEVEREGQRAFGSIRFEQPATRAWSPWSPAMGGFHVDLPPQRSVHEPLRIPGWNTSEQLKHDLQVQAYDPTTKGHFLVLATSFPDANYLEEDTFELAALSDAFAKELGLHRLSSASTSASGLPAQDDIFTNSAGDSVFTRIALQGGSYYLFAARCGGGQARRWFSTFGSEPYNATAPLETLTDSTMHCSMRTASLHKGLMGILDGFGPTLMKAWERSRGSGGKDKLFADERTTLVYESELTPECVKVQYHRLPRFDAAKPATFWDGQVRDLTDRNGITVARRQESTVDGMRVLDVWLTRPACSRAIRVRQLVHGQSIWKLRACVDTLHPSPWVDTFFTSFRPLDTLPADELFTPKGPLFMSYLTGTDTVAARVCRNSFDAVSFTDADAASLAAWSLSPDAMKATLVQRKEAIVALGQVHGPTVLPTLARLYALAGDSADLQLVILRAMAFQHTTKAADLFVTSVLKETPITTQEWRVDRAFEPFHDSLAAAVGLFPRLDALIAYDEYAMPVRRLKAALVEAHLLRPAGYAADKQVLLAKARLALKRAISESRNSNGRSYAYDDDDGPPTQMQLMDLEDVAAYLPGIDTMGTESPRAPWSDRDELGVLDRLLLPFQDDPGVRAHFDKVLAVDADEVSLPLAWLLKDGSGKAAPAFWSARSQRKDLQWWLYDRRGDLGLDSTLFTDLLSDERHLVEAAAFTGEAEAEKDSLTCFADTSVSTRFGEAHLYFFRERTGLHREDDDAKWNVSTVGVLHRPAADPFAALFSGPSASRVTRSELAEKVNDLSKDLRYEGRHRWKSAPSFSWSFGTGDQ